MAAKSRGFACCERKRLRGEGQGCQSVGFNRWNGRLKIARTVRATTRHHHHVRKKNRRAQTRDQPFSLVVYLAACLFSYINEMMKIISLPESSSSHMS
jgi:hypothetical protein